MGQLSLKLRSVGGSRLGYWCQGCESLHHVKVVGDPGSHPLWGYNGNPEAPTFTPSVLVTYDGPDADQVDEDGTRNPSRVCHTFITNGQVQFLGDCTHQFAGQTLPLPDLPPEYQDALAS